MSINKNSLRLKVKKAINKMPDTVQVYRYKQNDFKEETEEKESIVEITGQYYDKTKGSYISLNLSEGASIKDDRKEKFMVIVDEDSLKIQEGDFFGLNGRQYKIIDLGNTMDVYFDFSLEQG